MLEEYDQWEPIPRSNLERWIDSSQATQQHPDYDSNDAVTFTARGNIAYWTVETGDPNTALRLLTDLHPDSERVRRPDHPDALTTRSSIAGWTGQTGDPNTALTLREF